MKEKAFLTDKQRVCCLLATTEGEAHALLSGRHSETDLEAIARRVGLDFTQVQEIVSTQAALHSARINPNQLTPLQLQQVPTLSAQTIRTVLAGGPYYSLEEFESASGMTAALVQNLFSIPELDSIDKVSGRRRHFSPVPGKYIASSALDFESPHSVQQFGYVEQQLQSNTRLRILRRQSLDDAVDQTHLLKYTLGGQLYPVLCDEDGAEHYYIPANIDVWFKQDTEAAQAQQVIHEAGLRVLHSHARIGFYQVDLGDYKSTDSVLATTFDKIEQLQADALVKFAELTEIAVQDFWPVHERRTPDFESSVSGDRLWYLSAIELAAAHELTLGSANVTIMVIDSGCHTDHQDLAGALRPDWQTLDLNFDFHEPDSLTSPQEQTVSHGTKVASLACGRGPGGSSRVRGVAPGCWLLPVKISGAPTGQSYGFRAVAIREAIDYVAPGTRGVINLSWSTQGEHLGIREALFDASDKGFAIVTSAGNFTSGEHQVADITHYPSSYAYAPGGTPTDVDARKKIPGLASVAAMNASGRKASYSYYGKKTVTISAPGGEPGPAGTGMFVASTPDSYSYDAGTSFAAPIVSGLVALLFSVKPELTAQEAIDMIRTTAVDTNTLNPDYVHMLGAGQINARLAVEMATGKTVNRPSPDTGTPSPTPTSNTVAGQRLDINSATLDQVAALPYLGFWSACRIIARRMEHGTYQHVDDLLLSGVIDGWTLDQIRPLITVLSPSLEGIAPGTTPPTNVSTANTLTQDTLSVNTATLEELLTLKMIGPWAANTLINFRQDHGPFNDSHALLRSGVVDSWSLQQLLQDINFETV